MKIAICSDIHADLAALETFLGHIQGINIDALYILGDITGYGEHPNECIERIIELQASGLQVVVIKGNHDEIISEDMSPLMFNDLAAEAALHHMDILTVDNKKWLRSLPYEARLETPLGPIAFVHGTLESYYDYIIDDEEVLDAARQMESSGVSILFCGHSHEPAAFLFNEHSPTSGGSRNGFYNAYQKDRTKAKQEIRIEAGQKAIINVGGISQSRDGDPRGSFVVWDSKKFVFVFNRFD
jgi:predicted phosphodiesterase